MIDVGLELVWKLVWSSQYPTKTTGARAVLNLGRFTTTQQNSTPETGKAGSVNKFSGLNFTGGGRWGKRIAGWGKTWQQGKGAKMEIAQEAPFYTTHEVARILACSIWTVRRMVDDGDLKAMRIGRRSLRFDPADLMAYVKRQKTKGINQ